MRRCCNDDSRAARRRDSFPPRDVGIGRGPDAPMQTRQGDRVAKQAEFRRRAQGVRPFDQRDVDLLHPLVLDQRCPRKSGNGGGAGQRVGRGVDDRIDKARRHRRGGNRLHHRADLAGGRASSGIRNSPAARAGARDGAARVDRQRNRDDQRAGHRQQPPQERRIEPVRRPAAQATPSSVCSP